MIDTRLKTFLMLCKIRNYRKTAEALHMTQPAVTQHIHYLEQAYNCRLFHYENRILTLTKQGKILQTYAQNMCYQEKQLQLKLQQHEGRTLRIGVTKTVGGFEIDEKITNYLKVKGNNICVVMDNTDHLLQLLSEGELDFALVEGTFDRNQYASRMYKKEEFVGVCDKSHPFANKIIPAQDMFKEHLFLREEGSGTRHIFESILKEYNHDLNEFSAVTTISDFGLMMHLIKELKGITFAYKSVLKHDYDLCSFHIQDYIIYHQFNYVYLNNPVSLEAVDYFDQF